MINAIKNDFLFSSGETIHVKKYIAFGILKHFIFNTQKISLQ